MANAVLLFCRLLLTAQAAGPAGAVKSFGGRVRALQPCLHVLFAIDRWRMYVVVWWLTFGEWKQCLMEIRNPVSCYVVRYACSSGRSDDWCVPA